MPRKSTEQFGAERVIGLPKFSAGESVPEAATSWVDPDSTVEWKPICGDPNNRGNIEIVETDVQGLVELLTNSSDAYLIQNLDGVDSRKELVDSLDDEEVLVEFTGDSSGRGESEYSVIVADNGCGVPRDEFENAFLLDPSLGGVDKRKYKFLYGEFGQGSLASIGVSKQGCKFVASASKQEPEKWSWSVTRYNSEKKRYEYLTVDGSVPTFDGKLKLGCSETLGFGTVTKVFDIDSTQTPKDVTKNPFIRRLGHAFPETAVPLDIIDNRNGKNSNRKWKGMKPEIESEEGIKKFTKSVDLDQFGSIEIDVFIADEDESFDNEFVNSQSRDRLFFTVYGMTHHTESYRTLSSQCDLNGINEDVLIFINCSNLDTPINDIFLPSRTGVKEGEDSELFMNEVYSSIREWNQIQKIDKERASVADIVGSDGDSPLKKLEFETFDEPVPSVSTTSGEATVNFKIDASEEEYCEWEHVEFEVVGFTGESDINVSDNTVSLTISPLENSTVTFCVSDTEFNETLTRTFNVRLSPQDQEPTKGFTGQKAAVHGQSTGGPSKDDDPIRSQSENTNNKVPETESILTRVPFAYSNISENLSIRAEENTNVVGGLGMEQLTERLINSSGKEVSASGGKNHPPDFLVKKGCAVESKSQASNNRVMLNSSFPKHTLSSDSKKINSEVRDALEDSGIDTREMVYMIGNKTDSGMLDYLFVCQASTLFSSHEIEDVMSQMSDLSEEIASSKGYEASEDTNEIMNYSGMGESGNIGMRGRAMFQINHPRKIFQNEIPQFEERVKNGQPLFVTMEREKFESEMHSNKLESANIERYNCTKNGLDIVILVVDN